MMPGDQSDYLELMVHAAMIRDDLPQAAACFLFSVLPEVMKGSIHRMFRKKRWVSRIKLGVPFLAKDPQIHHRAIGRRKRSQ